MKIERGVLVIMLAPECHFDKALKLRSHSEFVTMNVPEACGDYPSV